jgi:gas vesicle protein
MDTILIILGVVVIAAGALYYFMKTGKIADKDGDLIPDVVEDKIEDVKKTAKEVKRRAKRVAEEAKDVADAVKEVVEQSKDVIEAAQGGKRKGKKVSKMTKAKLRGMNKGELVDLAKVEFNVEFDLSLTKTNLINKVYELYNKK